MRRSLLIALSILLLSSAASAALKGTQAPTKAIDATIAASDYGADGTGSTDASTALSNACTAANTAGVPLGLSGSYKVSSNLTLGCDLRFGAGAILLPDTTKTVTVNGKIGGAADTDFIFQGQGAVVANSPYVSVGWWGAAAAAAAGTDAGPAFRAAVGSNRVIKVPALAYTFTTTQSPPGDIAAFDNSLLQITSQANFVIEAYGASITPNNANALSAGVTISDSTNFKVLGLHCIGNRTGLTAGQENACIALSSDVSFTIRDLWASGNFGGEGAIGYGDWLVNGIIDGVRGDAVGQCFDFAFAKNVVFSNVSAVGVGNDGATGTGDKCVSNLIDTVNSSNNHTGVSFTDTDNLKIIAVDASNFTNGAWQLSSGQHIQFIGNAWHDNPGVGGYVNYRNGGAFTSVGHPPQHILIKGDRYSNNGSGANQGIFISSIGIAGCACGDLVNDIQIDADFENNNNTGITTDDATHTTNVTLVGAFTGANQTKTVGELLIDAPGTVIGSPPAAPANDNMLINPSFDIDQQNEGATYTASNPAMDGWRFNLSSAATSVTLAKSNASLPVDAENKALFTIGTGSATVNASDEIAIFQKLTGDMISNTAFSTSSAKALSLQFEAACSVTGTYSVALQNAALTRSLVHGWTVGTANTWQHYVIAVPGDTAAGWTISGNAAQMLVRFSVEAGSSLQNATKDTWLAGNYHAVNTQTQLSTTTGATCGITNVKLEVSPAPTPFQKRQPATELSLARQFYQKTFSGLAVGQNKGLAGALCTDAAAAAAGTFGVLWQFAYPMNSLPTITTFNPSAANANWRDTGGASDAVVLVDTMSAKGVNGVFIGEQTTVPTAGHHYCIHATADSRL